MSCARALAPLLLLALAASPARAQPPLETVSGWTVRDERGWCSASTVHGPDVHLRVAYDAGADLAEFYVWNRAWGWLRQGEAYDVALRFSNGRVHRGIVTRSIVLTVAGGSPVNGLWMRLRGRAFLDDFARAATMEPVLEGRGLGSLSLRGTSGVVQRLRACAGLSARRHPSARARIAPPGPPPPPGDLARPPVHRSGILTDEDYPAAALRAEHQGNVTIEMAVSADGLVTGCTVLASSGSPILDSASCTLAQRRFRFTPATDANGRPVAGTATRTFAWRIPEPDPEPVPVPQK